MRQKLLPPALVILLASVLILLRGTAAEPATLKCEATLVWGTNDKTPPPGKAYKPVSPEILAKLQQLPLKWTNWFEVRFKEFEAPQGVAKDVQISDKCQLKVKNLGNSELELLLIGKGKEVFRGKQTLSAGERFVLGGNAPNSTGWLVVLKRLN